VDPTEPLREEGPFGDHTGPREVGSLKCEVRSFSNQPASCPVFIPHSAFIIRHSLRPATIVGIPPMEDFYIGSASVKLFLPVLKMNFPEIVDITLPAEGVFHNLVFVSIRRTYPMQAYKSPCGRPPGTASGAWAR
jgi:4-hydroxy-3-polyprenylbenzoate decarboxylase